MEQGSLPIPPKPPSSRISRDEMNLAEFPLTVLSTRANPSVKTLEFRDTIKSKNGELVNREWTITAADKFGLPTASDDEVILGLLKLTVDSGFQSRKIYFTRYELLKALQWTTEGRSYQRLQKALDRLSGVRIKAKNAFFDNQTKSHSTINFGLIDAYEINDARDASKNDPLPSFFTWSEVLFNSFQVGYIKKLDLAFYLSLKSAVSKRLFRYLDKHFWYKTQLRINVFLLAHEKLGVSRNYRFFSSLRQQLDPALDELKDKGIISDYDYEGRGPSAEVIVRAAGAVPRVNARSDGASSNSLVQGELKTGPKSIQPSNKPSRRPVTQNLAVGDDCHQPNLYSEILDALVVRGITPQQVERLLQFAPTDKLERIKKIIEHYDHLVQSRSRLVRLSPVGFLYRAIERPDDFRLPDDQRRSSEQAPLKLPPKSLANKHDKNQKLKQERNTSEADYLVFRRKQLEEVKEKVESKLLTKLRHEVEEALKKVRGLISSQRFHETVEIGVEERLAKLFAVPTFDEWCETSKLA